MKLKFNGFLTLLLVLITQVTFAQDIAVSGTVTDAAGLPIPGVNVLVKGTSNGTQTDFDGNFKLTASQGQVLVFSFLGMKTVQLPAAANMKVKMADDSVQLEGVVVTALGITRDKKSLGYSSQKVDAAAVNAVPTNNFLNNLAGKVAGLEIRSNSNFGGSTNIVLRGNKSLTGNNQALIVVDGVPMTNANLNKADAANSRDGYDFGNSASDIDPNNIESVNVLKGAAATALYGSQAANGAIMITTKKGKMNSAIGVTFNSSASIGEIDRDTFARYQKGYGGGGYEGHDNLYVVDVNGDGVDDLLVPTGYDISYGNAFDPNLMVYQWNAFAAGNPNFGKATPWLPAKNDPASFFEKSVNLVNSITVNGGDEKNTYNLTVTNNDEKGVMPNSTLKRNILSGNFSHALTDKFKVGAFFTFTDQNTVGRNGVGYGDNFIGGFRQWWQTNVDIKELKQEYFRNRENVTWNMNDPLSGDLSPAYWNNPYWDRYENYESDVRRRMLTGVNVNYDITDDINLIGRVTIDNSNDRQEVRKAIGSHSEEFGVSQIDESSGYGLYTRAFLQQTYDLIGTWDFKIGSAVGGKLLLGGTFIKSRTDEFEGSTAGGLGVPRFYNLANSKTYVAPIEGEVNLEKSGIYAQASFDFKKTFFIEGSVRQDQSTALSVNNNKYNYGSAGASFVVSELVKADWLNLFKLRGSYAVVGNDPGPGTPGFRINNGLSGDGSQFYQNSATYVDFGKLKPEQQHTTEFGVEGGFFNNRVNFDVSVYKSNTTDQIFNVPQSTSTGYSFSRINAGELENKGIEVAFSATPVKTKDFSWNIGVNWSQNRNKVVALDAGRENLQLASFQSGLSLNATVGQPYGTIRGTDYQYDPSGNKIVGDDGNYLQADDKVIGNIQANWIGGVSNKVTYKNLSFNFLIDIKQGGDVFSLDQGYGQDTGLYPETAGFNDLGNPVRNTLDNGGGYINPGVMINPAWTPTNGVVQYIPNTTRVDASDSSEASGLGYGISANPDKAYVYDAGYVKLREVGLTYSFSDKMLERSFIKGLSVSLIGNNVWIIDKSLPHADPEAGTSAGNIQGYQSGVMPSVKVYSLNLKVNF